MIGWAQDADATFVLRKRRRTTAERAAGGLAAFLLLIGLAAELYWPFGHVRPAADTLPPLAGEATILAQAGDATQMFRFAPSPAIPVMVFPSLHAQALTLNRAAAYIERAGLPRDRVLDDAALDTAIAASHARFDTYYQGHDYRAADLAAFFATAARQHVALRAEELALRDRLAALGVATGALITAPPAGDGILDAAGRGTILRHELSHGAYFTDQAYAAYVRSFWARSMDDAARAAFRAYLARNGYDGANEDLLRNEMQAYLAFTPDRRLFDADRLAIGAAAVDALRARFVDGMPDGWLRARAAS